MWKRSQAVRLRASAGARRPDAGRARLTICAARGTGSFTYRSSWRALPASRNSLCEPSHSFEVNKDSAGGGRRRSHATHATANARDLQLCLLLVTNGLLERCETASRQTSSSSNLCCRSVDNTSARDGLLCAPLNARLFANEATARRAHTPPITCTCCMYGRTAQCNETAFRSSKSEQDVSFSDSSILILYYC